MRNVVIFVAGILAGVTLCGVGAWLWLRHEMRDYAATETPRVPNAEERFERAKAELDSATSEYDRWLALGDFGFWIVDAGTLEIARASALEVLASAKNYQKDWNYGNAIHKGNLTLGRVALRNGDLEQAKAYLLAAGGTPGSPQLNSFGPNMTLAKVLLEAGETDAVLQYLDLCAEFWKTDFGSLGAWRDLIEEGRIPNFGANLVY
jgi:hypothetical protein